jgi:alkylhydroperoxidase family enzyme
VHAAAFATQLGFSAEQLASTVRGSAEDDVWSDCERAVFALADGLHETGTVTDELFSELRRHFDDAQILELAVTSGWYHTISYLIATARVPLEPWAARFPGQPARGGAVADARATRA